MLWHFCWVKTKFISGFQNYNGEGDGGCQGNLGYFCIEEDNSAFFERTVLALNFFIHGKKKKNGNQVPHETEVDHLLGEIIAKQCKSKTIPRKPDQNFECLEKDLNNLCSVLVSCWPT